MMVMKSVNSVAGTAAVAVSLLLLCLAQPTTAQLPLPVGSNIDLTQQVLPPKADNSENADDGIPQEQEAAANLVSSSSPSSMSIRFVDDDTRITHISTLLTDRSTSVFVDNWWSIVSIPINDNNMEDGTEDDNEKDQTISMRYTTYMDDVLTFNGTMTFASMTALMTFYQEQPKQQQRKGDDSDNSRNSLYCGSITPKINIGTSKIRVEFQYNYHEDDDDDYTATVETAIRTYNPWIMTVPIAIPWLLFLFINVPLVLSLFVGSIIGSSILEGSFFNGFKTMFDTHLLGAASDPSHVALILFVLFMTTFGTLVTVSGGTAKMFEVLSGYTSRSRLVQSVLVVVGCIFFFDPYASIVLVGNSFGPIMKIFPVSPEKFAYILDATALPVSTLVPISTFFTIGSDLLQQELDKVDNFIDEQGISANSIMLGSIQYQLYPIFILVLLITQTCSRREVGWLLNMENMKLDLFNKNGGPDLGGAEAMNPNRAWNWWIPVVTVTALAGLSFAFMYFDSSMDDITYTLAAWMTAAGVSVTFIQIIYLFQTRRDGTIGCCGYHHRGERPDLTFLMDTLPSGSTAKSGSGEATEDEDDLLVRQLDSKQTTDAIGSDPLPVIEPKPQPSTSTKKSQHKPHSLLTLHESFHCYIESGRKYVPMIFALIASWSASEVYLSLGIDRIVAGWIIREGMTSKMLPIVTFFSSFLLSCIVGSMYTTMAILVPIVTVPALEIVDGSVDLFVFFLGSLISGAVGGCHFGLFSETTILSGITAESDVRKHFLSKFPYTLLVLIVGSGAGTVPVSLGVYPDFAGMIIGIGVILMFVILICRPIDSASMKTAVTSSTRRRFQFRRGSSDEKNVGADNGDPKEIDAESLKSRNNKSGLSASSALDPIQELFEDGTLPADIRQIGSFTSTGTSLFSTATPIVHNSRSRSTATPLLHNRTSSTQATQLVRNIRSSRTTSLTKTTIYESEEEGGTFSPSLRKRLRVAETELERMINESDDDSDSEDGSSTDGSHTDDSLDNLMANIAHKAKSAVRHLAGNSSGTDDDDDDDDDEDNSAGSDNGDSTTSESVGNGASTAFTGATSYTDDGDEDDDDSASEHSDVHSDASTNYDKSTFLSSVISSPAEQSTTGSSSAEPSKASF